MLFYCHINLTGDSNQDSVIDLIFGPKGNSDEDEDDSNEENKIPCGNFSTFFFN